MTDKVLIDKGSGTELDWLLQAGVSEKVRWPKDAIWVKHSPGIQITHKVSHVGREKPTVCGCKGSVSGAVIAEGLELWMRSVDASAHSVHVCERQEGVFWGRRKKQA